MSEFAGELHELIGGGESLFLGPGLLIIPGGGGELGWGEGTFLPPWSPIVAAPVGGETPRWKAVVGSWYSAIWILLGPRMPWTPYQMPFVMGPGRTLGSTATPEEIVAVKRQILKWKSPHAYPDKVILAFDSLTSSPPGPVIILGRRGLKMPFVCPDFGGGGAPYCTWRMGKLMNDTLGNMPFAMGGYQV